ncbi:hypothetical protein M2480_000413 [Parabacteroides sp. PFB2-12]|uniref:hypothetical protein n=1 Tax=unclassified Parabacteroides TaxID=2649774 RepID=UPI0024741089|nr:MULTISPECIES: hypothetical protein [unclassified Parabacteroides]MDH6342033.1 hypothetical protein [Parabacteroides sp. PM6-13]MDH6389453.1 hypothetical protein [Parabacteroides sp. PFB2-12]
MKKVIVLVAAICCIPFVFNSCDNALTEEKGHEVMLTKADVPEFGYCGEPYVTPLIAGKQTPVGTITVGNDKENLYVTYALDASWSLSDTKLFVGDDADIPFNGNNPQMGHFPYKTTHSPAVNTFTYVIPLEEISACVTVAAQGDVVPLEGKKESAWGEGDALGKNGSMKFEYCVQECIEVPAEPIDYQTESAWSAGDRYTEQGNWATFTAYTGEELTVPVIAGKSIEVGTVTFSEVVDGNITITIALTGGWELNAKKTETVKIQGYDVAPSGNPAPGQFATYKGESLVVDVPASEYYGIHLDVRLPIYE